MDFSDPIKVDFSFSQSYRKMRLSIYRMFPPPSLQHMLCLPEKWVVSWKWLRTFGALFPDLFSTYWLNLNFSSNLQLKSTIMESLKPTPARRRNKLGFVERKKSFIWFLVQLHLNDGSAALKVHVKSASSHEILSRQLLWAILFMEVKFWAASSLHADTPLQS